jgi:hypothetical protein
MKRRLNRIQVVLVIVASVLVLGFPGDILRRNLAGDDFCSPGLSGENPNQDNMVVENLNGLKIFGSNGLLGVFLLKKKIFERLPLVSFKKTFL